MAVPHNKDYLLGHVPAVQENPRLDTQHERITHGIMKGRLVHESIPLDTLEGPVADICCGTGVWLNDLSKHVAKTQNRELPDFIGFDLNPKAFRDTDGLAGNVRLVEHDCIHPFDDQYRGRFGLVNMRGLAFAIPKGQFSSLFRNAVSLLRPGGYLQWLDTEPQLWQSLPKSADFDNAVEMVCKERDCRALVSYMPDFMLQEYFRVIMEYTTSAMPDPSSRGQISLIHFSLTPGGAARHGAGLEHHLNDCFSDTVSETLQLLLQGFISRTQDKADGSEAISDSEVAEPERLKDFIAETRRTRELSVSGFFPLLIAQSPA